MPCPQGVIVGTGERACPCRPCFTRRFGGIVLPWFGDRQPHARCRGDVAERSLAREAIRPTRNSPANRRGRSVTAAGERGIRLVTFDLDDTLWRIEGVIQRAEAKMREWLRERAPNYREPDAAELRAIQQALLETHPGIQHDISWRRELMVRAVLERSGYAAAMASKLAAEAFAVFLSCRHQVRLLPDAPGVLGRLRRHYTLAALTNGNADYRRLGLGRYFAFGYRAGAGLASKPAPDMFERALARANVEPEQAVHVGDHPVNDIQGAANAGMATIWARVVPEATAPDALGGVMETPSRAPNATITSLRELPAAVAALG